ncbi:MAG: 30S ribosomal protein S17 [Patescibacteria group bacterium]|nr:30S ribosomal protein S17 [Patescibacteria group bacterium]MDD4610512.1 30S ribosomal protein S17 [Patescibacteria group bacterium]
MKEGNKTKKIIKKKLMGVVVSDKMDKTILVRVDRIKIHPKYGKRYTVSKKYKVHDEKNQYKEDDKVIFIECRPISKDKKWRVIYS